MGHLPHRRKVKFYSFYLQNFLITQPMRENSYKSVRPTLGNPERGERACMSPYQDSTSRVTETQRPPIYPLGQAGGAGSLVFVSFISVLEKISRPKEVLVIRTSRISLSYVKVNIPVTDWGVK